MNMADLDEKIAKLEDLLKQTKARKQKNEAQKRAALQKANRSNDTRRKILVGSLVLAETVSEVQQAELKKRLDVFLTRASDRAIFELPVLKVQAA